SSLKSGNGSQGAETNSVSSVIQPAGCHFQESLPIVSECSPVADWEKCLWRLPVRRPGLLASRARCRQFVARLLGRESWRDKTVPDQSDIRCVALTSDLGRVRMLTKQLRRDPVTQASVIWPVKWTPCAVV